MKKMAVTIVRCGSTERLCMLKDKSGLWCFPEADVSDTLFTISHAVVSCLSAIGDIRNIMLMCIVSNQKRQKDLEELYLYLTEFDEEKGIDVGSNYKTFGWLAFENVFKLKTNASPVSQYAIDVLKSMSSDG